MITKVYPGVFEKIDINTAEVLTMSADIIVQDIYDNYTCAKFYKLKNIPFGSCHLGAVRVDWQGNKIYHIFLKSYSTIVCGFTLLDDETFYAWCTGTYSQTTRKHINRFCHEICDSVTYYWFKQIAEMSNQCVWYNGCERIVEEVTHNINRYWG